MHAQGIYHTDLKLDNIFVTHNFEIWIGDFAYATWNQRSEDIWGSKQYNSPEVVANKTAIVRQNLDCSIQDSFSLGVILFGLISGRFPFGEASSWTLYGNFMNGKVDKYWAQ